MIIKLYAQFSNQLAKLGQRGSGGCVFANSSRDNIRQDMYQIRPLTCQVVGRTETDDYVFDEFRIGRNSDNVQQLAAANRLETQLLFVDNPNHVVTLYVGMRHINKRQVGGELKKGSAELLILSLIEHRPRHGYEIGKLIETRSVGVLRFNVASLYPLLYRLEQRGLIKGQWVEKPGQRRRRFYQLTAQGRKMLKHQQGMWREFVNAMELITGAEHA